MCVWVEFAGVVLCQNILDVDLMASMQSFLRTRTHALCERGWMCVDVCFVCVCARARLYGVCMVCVYVCLLGLGVLYDSILTLFVSFPFPKLQMRV